MNFNTHSHLEGKHAFLSPSSYHWINYNDQKMTARWLSSVAAARGTALHDYAQRAIELGIKQAKTKETINQYINDAIGYKMSVEQVLYYSDNCFGTADTLSFRKNFLRIHDLKTGITKSSFNQLVVYAAIFCLEYEFFPYDIEVELRLYQNNEIYTNVPAPELIESVMAKIITFDRQIEMMKAGVFE